MKFSVICSEPSKKEEKELVWKLEKEENDVCLKVCVKGDDRWWYVFKVCGESGTGHLHHLLPANLGLQLSLKDCSLFIK